MTISIDSSVLSSYFSAQAGLSAANAVRQSGAAATATSGSGTGGAVAPWQSASAAPQQSALVKSVLNGGAFFNAASSSSLSGGTSVDSADYTKLFALYQGVNALQGLAAAAGASTATAAQQATYAKAFATGMTQLQSYLSTTSFQHMSVVAGQYTASDTSSVGTAAETDVYQTGTVYSGSAGAAVPAFASASAFNITLSNPFGVKTVVPIDLSQMGSTPRTMANVADYINAQLKAAGSQTKFSVVDTPVPAQTTTVNGKSVTLAQPPDNFAFKITGVTNEALSFSAATSSPVVYMAAATVTPATTNLTGSTSASSSASSSASTSTSPELVKLATTASGAAPQATTPLAAAVQSALATATGPDGSVYVVGDLSGNTDAGQNLQGAGEVGLMKYDSAGNLLYTRVLGGAGTTTGYALAVSADGTSVAVSGQNVPAAPATSTVSGYTPAAAPTTAFVTSFDAAGDQNWTSTEASANAGPATGLAFGADGSLYVTGSSTGTLPNAVSAGGGTGAYLQSYSKTGTLNFTEQFGPSGTAPAGVAVSGSSVYVASTEGGHAVARAFTVSGSTASQTATRDLGALDGKLAGVGVTSSGSVVIAGSTTNGALSAGTVTTAYASGSEGFVASLGASLTPASGDTLTYVAAPGNLTASAMTVSGGSVYLAGAIATTPPYGSGLTNTSAAYAAAINPVSGATTWSDTVQGPNNVAAPTSIAVATNDSPTLDAFGLPNAINYAPSALVTSNTGLAVGSSFSVKVGSGTPQKITIGATDTLTTLAAEINSVSGNAAHATTSTIGSTTSLVIKPANSSMSVTLINGPTGSDVLAGLGITAGTISAEVTATSSSSAPKNGPLTLGLNLPTTLNLNSPTAIKAAQTALALAGAKIENAYTAMSSGSASSASSTSSAASAAAIAASKAQVANYQQALSWLQNNESSTTSTTGSVLSLI